ncbi:MAG: selenocysteine-specific translation elongation factor [Sneathiellaceae bacterium]
MILAIAGHVDHGKTAMVAALTGTDTDRLPEEKARGMSIDIGFAYADLAGGRRIGLVDMPGHERFLGNLIAGLAAVDGVLLVVAADSGPQAQTHAQLAILSLLDLPPSLVVLSKVDRVDDARRAAASAEAQAALRAAGMADRPLQPFSAASGEGRAALLSRLHELAGRQGAGNGPWARDGRFRLSVDRAFLRPGAGPVVTGGVTAGRLAAGDAAMLSPAGIAVRAREIRAMDRPAEVALAGQRCAIGLSARALDRAGVGRSGGIGRGQWLLHPDLHRPSQRLDVLLRPGAGLPTGLPDGRQVTLHLGAARLQARLALHDLPPGAANDAVAGHLRLDRPVAALAGDRLLLRDPASGAALAAGRVLDPWPPDRGMMRPARAAQVAALAMPDGSRQAAALLAASPDGVDLARLALSRNAEPAALAGLYEGVGAVQPVPGLALAPAEWRNLQAALADAVAAAHAAAPEASGIGRGQIVRAVSPRRPAALAAAGLDALVAAGRLAERGDRVARPGHVPRLRAADEALWLRLAPLLAERPPPTVPVLGKRLGLSAGSLDRALGRLATFGHLVRIAGNRVVAAADLAVWQAALRDLAARNPVGIRDFCDATGLGRNFAVALLEHCDRTGMTRPDGAGGRVLATEPDGAEDGPSRPDVIKLSDTSFT